MNLPPVSTVSRMGRAKRKKNRCRNIDWAFVTFEVSVIGMMNVIRTFYLYIYIFKHFLKNLSTYGTYIYIRISLIVLISLRYMGMGVGYSVHVEMVPIAYASLMGQAPK